MAVQAPTWWVYIVRCSDRSLYCGSTNDLEARIAAHNAGRGARYTRGRGPVWRRFCAVFPVLSVYRGVWSRGSAIAASPASPVPTP